VSKDRVWLLQEFASVDRPATLTLTLALGGTRLNLVAANHVIIMQKFWNGNQQRQAVARIHSIGQRRIPMAWILHCETGVDDRAEEFHKSRGKCEVRVMHRLIGQKLFSMELMAARATRIRELEGQSATQASAAGPGPSGTQGGDAGTPSPSGTQGADDGTPGLSRIQGSDDGTPNSYGAQTSAGSPSNPFSAYCY